MDEVSSGLARMNADVYKKATTGEYDVFSRDLTTPHLDLSHFALCIMGS